MHVLLDSLLPYAIKSSTVSGEDSSVDFGFEARVVGSPPDSDSHPEVSTPPAKRGWAESLIRLGSVDQLFIQIEVENSEMPLVLAVGPRMPIARRGTSSIADHTI